MSPVTRLTFRLRGEIERMEPQLGRAMPEDLRAPAMDPELERFKRINLAEYATSHGYRLVQHETTRSGARRRSTRSSLLMRHPATDDKIVVRLDVDGHWTYFSVRDDCDNGTIIDFLQKRSVRDLAQVREELRRWSGQERELPLVCFRAPVPAGPRDRSALVRVFEHASIAIDHTYLNSRGIRRETLSCERLAGTWRVDAGGDLLFPHRDEQGICGFERKNRRWAGFVSGGTKTIWASNARDDDVKLVFTEAVIDAFSYHQLTRDDRARYASTGGAFGERQARHVARAIDAMSAQSAIVLATDKDDAGERLANKIAALAGPRPVLRHRPPIGKDWNESLQEYEREYIQALRSRVWGLGR